MDAKALQDDLQNLGFTPRLAKPDIGMEVGRRRAGEKKDRGGREAAGDGATGRSVEAFQFGGIGNA